MPNGLVTTPRVTPMTRVEAQLERWPAAIQHMAWDLIRKYGLPSELTNSFLVWHYNGSWKRTVLHRQAVRHNFPRPHGDALEQVVDLWVPIDKVAELAAFDGSLMVERTCGELAVRCASEEMNILILNLAHDIVMGELDAPTARRRCTQVIRGRLLNWPLPQMQELTFATNVQNAERRTADPDQAT